jgi:hypothetical protein
VHERAAEIAVNAALTNSQNCTTSAVEAGCLTPARADLIGVS